VVVVRVYPMLVVVAWRAWFDPYAPRLMEPITAAKRIAVLNIDWGLNAVLHEWRERAKINLPGKRHKPMSFPVNLVE
jgi:hypothetical protein